MIEPLILGFSWLDKWQPHIWWEGGFRKLQLAVGLEPVSEEEQPESGKERVAGEVEFPPVYTDLSQVFDKAECEVLPPP